MHKGTFLQRFPFVHAPDPTNLRIGLRTLNLVVNLHCSLNQMTLIYVIVGAFVLLALLVVAKRSRAKPLLIESPKLGALNLKGSSCSQMVIEDMRAVSGSFSSVEERTNLPVPSCNVLFVYCDFESDGKIAGTPVGLREVIRDSGALIVVVASETSREACMEAVKPQPAPYGRANLVLTLDRRGMVFASFYRRLFEQMAKGVTMPVAWVSLAPQIPGRDHIDCPTGAFLCEAGQVAFAYGSLQKC